MSLFWDLLLSIGIPVLYLLIGSAIGTVTYRVVYAKSSGYNDSAKRGDAVIALWMAVFFWPLAWAPLFAYSRGTLESNSDGLTRRQRQTLAFERERAEIAERANKAQREWLRLVEGEKR